MKNFSEVVGWGGTFLIVLAYFLNTFGFISVEGIAYPIINLLGAVFLGFSVAQKKAWAATALQVVWSIIAIVSLVGMFFKGFF